VEPKRKTTIYDVATASGVSASTVGSVLNGSWSKRRISKDLAARVLAVASTLGYRQNRQASALRTQRSGLIGMILPLHDNRYFSSMSQAFEAEARKRDLCPMVVSTLRDPEMEKRTVATLLSHNVDLLFIAGATDPDPLSRMCAEAGIPHINVDLPGSLAASVVTDNYFGACELTRYLMSKVGTSAPATMHFIGGIPTDFNTMERVRGFRDVLLAETGAPPDPAQIDTCGYGPDEAERSVRRLLDRLGTVPSGLFVNSTIAFEGVFRVLKELPDAAFLGLSVGCFDWDPFLSHLHFPVAMVRQDAKSLIEKAFRIIYDNAYDTRQIHLIKPELLLPAPDPEQN
jgi:LacI family transcriptional regulator, fructose operon transcriptional repressor